MAPTEPITVVEHRTADDDKGVGWVTVSALVLALVHVILLAVLVLVVAYGDPGGSGQSETNVTQTQNLGPEVSDAQVGPEVDADG